MQATRLFTVLFVSFFCSVTAHSLKAQQTKIIYVPLYTFHGDNLADLFGSSVSGAGDVNGDGVNDLIVGAFLDDNNDRASGSARVFSGSDGSVLYNFDGDSQFDNFGISVSGAGDINGDGKTDLFVGASGDANNGVDSGSASVLSGSDGSVLYNFDGESFGVLFGFSVSGAGDVNGDGTTDLLVGTPQDVTNGLNSGSARVLSGSDGSVLYNFDGDSLGDSFGFSVNGAGDVNGDGRADLIVGARFGDNNGVRSGYARVLSGSDGSVLYDLNGDSEFDRFGSSVSGAGDVNGDGMADLLVGTPQDDNNGLNSGNARVFSGSDGSVLYNFDGDSADDNFGNSVSGAGDVNEDGFDDFIVGAPQDNNSGSVRVFSGSDGSVLYDFDGDRANDNFGISVSGVGDVNGDGLDDFIVGASRGGANDGGYARVFVSQIVLPGDVNQDGFVNFSDIGPFITILSAGDFLAEADVNCDSLVNFSDIGPFIAILSL